MSLQDNSVVRDSGISIFNGLFYYSQRTNLLPYEHLTRADGSYDERWMDVLYGLFPGPAILCVIGVCIVLFLCCWLNMARPSPGLDGSPAKRPRRVNLRITARTAALVIWIFSFFCLARGSYMVISLRMQVERIRPEIEFIGATLDRLQPQVHNAAIWLQEWQTSCVGYKYIKDNIPQNLLEQNANITAQLPEYSYQLYTVREEFRAIPQLLERFDKVSAMATGYIWVAILLALIPAIIPSFFIYMIMQIARLDAQIEGDDDHDGEESRQLVERLRICSIIPMIFAVLILVIVAAVVMFMGDTLGLYCENREENTVRLVSAFVGNGNMTSNSTTQLVSFYLLGHPKANPMVELLKKARHYVSMANDLSAILLPALNVVGMLCGRIGNAHPARLIHEVLPDINRLLPEVRRDTMYARFDGLVNKGVCTLGVSAIFWWWVTMVLAAVVIMPLMLYHLNRYLLDHEEWDKCKDERIAVREAERLLEEQKLASKVDAGLASYKSRQASFWDTMFGCNRAPRSYAGFDSRVYPN